MAKARGHFENALTQSQLIGMVEGARHAKGAIARLGKGT